MTNKDNNGFEYTTYTNDPVGLRVYKLKNGLTVYLSKNTDNPRINTKIVVKAGSKYDPADNTGLAHYLEHMVFKGTSKIASLDWEKEKPLLDKIKYLYEKHKAEKDSLKKKEIYKEIDSVSNTAAKYAIANEYDKMVTSIGANGTNAYTSNEETVYINDIPNNELERWLTLESERFNELTLRLFHTEIESVYEEFNMGQDSDFRRTYYKLMEKLFPNHPYGTQTTIGKAEHLKNPSLINIENYWKKYYVPNNMAICLSGDFDFDNTILLINKYFGNKKPNEITPHNLPKEKQIYDKISADILGPEAEFLFMAYRFDGIKSKEVYYIKMIDFLLSNSKAGLIDLNLVQDQKIQNGNSNAYFLNDYSYHIFSGYPKQNQSLEEVEEAFFGEIQKIQKGEFDQAMIEAILNDFEIDRIKEFETTKVADYFVDAFINEREWDEILNDLDNLKKITKKDIIEFANKHYNRNYVIVYKRIGKDDDIIKVDKPKITPVSLNRIDESEFFTNFKNQKTVPILPVFVDFKKEIDISKTNYNADFYYINNKTNDLFELNYIINIGKNHNKILPLALNYIKFIGTTKFSPSDFQKELFKLGITLKTSVEEDKSIIKLSGLKKNLNKGLDLVITLFTEPKSNDLILEKYMQFIVKDRLNKKLDKKTILWDAMLNYGKYGNKNYYNNALTDLELIKITNNDLFKIIKEIFNYNHSIFYYGNTPKDEVIKLIENKHFDSKFNKNLLISPEEQVYNELDINTNKIYFVNYDMVQTNIIFLGKSSKYDINQIPQALLFNEYFGYGLSSIVFQEIRESKALAYQAFSKYFITNDLKKSNYIVSFISTQVDKLDTAILAMNNLLNDMPLANNQYSQSKESILNIIESERIIKTDIFWRYFNLKKMGIDFDIRKNVYEDIKNSDLNKLNSFFEKEIKKSNLTYLILGNKKHINFKELSKKGNVVELELGEIFGY